MSPTLQDLGIDRLSVDDRIVLAQAIWDSIEPQIEQHLLREPQRQELADRLVAHDADPSDVVPWERIRTEANTRWAK
jgi:putative addiction module component (TIGR02574 family)